LAKELAQAAIAETAFRKEVEVSQLASRDDQLDLGGTDARASLLLTVAECLHSYKSKQADTGMLETATAIGP
jgi:hypothetical protein